MQSTLFEKDSLRFVPCRSQHGCDTRSAQRVNSDAPVVGIYDQTDFASADAKLCEAVCLHFSSRAEFVMTSTLPALWTSAPTTGFSVPVMASTMAMKLSVSENVILSLMVRIMRLESAMRCGSSVTSSSTSAISAASTAMSLPSAAHCDADIGGLERGRVVHAVADHADLIARGLIGADVGELFDARAGAGDGQLFEKTAELHDERDLTRGEVFTDADRRDQRERDEHVCLDVERRDKADDGL